MPTPTAGEIWKRAPTRPPCYIRRPTASTVITTCSLDSSTASLVFHARLLDTAMATQKFVDAQSSQQQIMNLTRLQTEVSNRTYKFTRPLTIVKCATQEKYIVYASCAYCLKRVQQQNNGYFCTVHQWKRVPVYRFALRVLLKDWIGTELWVTLFNEMAAKALVFTANSYVAMTSDEDRYASLSLLRGARVMATIKKHINNDCQLHRVRAGSARRSIHFVGRQRECRRHQHRPR